MNFRENRFARSAITLLTAQFVAQIQISALGHQQENASNSGSEDVRGNSIRSTLRNRIKNRLGKLNQHTDVECSKLQVAGLNVAVWKSSRKGKSPLVIFSHGFGGSSTQTVFLMNALAKAGYTVVAPDHKDAHGSSETHFRPQVSFKKVEQWSDQTYVDRHNDIVNLIAALHANPAWNNEINWNELALCGHSLGGYTVLGLAGAWPTWKIPGIKAVIALSPYVTPYIANGALEDLHTPVMYQGGTRDFGITPFVKKPGGAYAKTSSPAYFIEFNEFNHFSWSSFNRDREKQNEIDYYCVAFLDKYVRGEDDGKLEKKLADVVDFQVK